MNRFIVISWLFASACLQSACLQAKTINPPPADLDKFSLEEPEQEALISRTIATVAPTPEIVVTDLPIDAAPDSSEVTPEVAVPEVTEGEPTDTIKINGALLRKQNSSLRLGWYVQVASYDERIDAEIAIARLQATYPSAKVVKYTDSSGSWFIALLGPFASEAIAKENVAELKSYEGIGSSSALQLE